MLAKLVAVNFVKCHLMKLKILQQSTTKQYLMSFKSVMNTSSGFDDSGLLPGKFAGCGHNFAWLQELWKNLKQTAGFSRVSTVSTSFELS